MLNIQYQPAAVVIDGQLYPARYIVRPGRVVIEPETPGNHFNPIEVPETAPDYMDAWTIADAAARMIADPVYTAAEPVQPAADPVQASAADPEKRPETISAADPAPAAPPAVRFTTRSMIMGSARFRVRYSLADNETLEIKATADDGKTFVITLAPSHEHYQAARAAYDEKAAKRAKYDAEPRETPEKWFSGQELKGPGWCIRMDGSINRATVTFDSKPAPAVRELVKSAGFYWSPVHKQWSRGLTHKAWRAAQALAMALKMPADQRPETISA